MKVVTLAERPELADAVYGIPYPPGSPRFMRGSLAALLVRGRRVASRWPELVVALVDGDRPVVRSVLVPFRSRGDERCAFPVGGWDQVAVWAAEDALDGSTPDTACALEITVHPDYQGRGLSSMVIEAIRGTAASAGLPALVTPIRPPGKAEFPAMSMREYAGRTRPDGLPVDWWLRTHVRAGGRIQRLAPCSSTIAATLEQWREWTGLPFDCDGPVIVPGALAPVLVSTTHDVAVYVEPNVWLQYPTDE